MSTDDPFGSDASQNPYSAPQTPPQVTQQSGSLPLPPGQTRGMVGQAAIVGVLMAVQGAIDCLGGIIAAFYAVLMPSIMAEAARQQAAQGGGQPMPENIGTFFAVGGGIVAVVMIGLGILLIYSGISVARYQRRTLAIITLASGLMTLFTCYCFPTSLLLGIYGMIFLFNQPVAYAFELRSNGYSPQEIQRAFLMLP